MGSNSIAAPEAVVLKDKCSKKKFVKFSEKHLCWSLFRKETGVFLRILQNTFFYRTPPGDCL